MAWIHVHVALTVYGICYMGCDLAPCSRSDPFLGEAVAMSLGWWCMESDTRVHGIQELCNIIDPCPFISWPPGSLDIHPKWIIDSRCLITASGIVRSFIIWDFSQYPIHFCIGVSPHGVRKFCPCHVIWFGSNMFFDLRMICHASMIKSPGYWVLITAKDDGWHRM